MIEYAIGPILAVLINLKFNQVSQKKFEEKLTTAEAKIEKLEKVVETIDRETLKKMMTTIAPVAKAVMSLQEAVGVQ
jgi:ferritin-like metal-binding protein YciE